MKNLILVLLMAFTISVTAQEKIKVAFYQDVKLATMEDDYGNEPFTLDLLAKVKLTGNQEKFGYMVIAPMFEYAEIEGIYKRYAFDVGYTFNKLVINNLEATGSINYGIQDRWKKSWLVFGADAELAYKITDNISFSLLAQFVQRKDLQWAYGTKVIRFSGFAGVILEL